MSDEVVDRLRDALAGYRVVEIDGRRDFRRELTPRATVVVAGGDGTVGTVARALAGSGRRLGIVPVGTFNNFAAALGLPLRVDSAIEVIRAGRTRPVTLGRVNGRPFLEVAAIGMFGDAIVLGEAAKDLEFGRVAGELRAVAGARPFAYTMSGDLEGSGMALSLVFTNTPSTGARMPVGAKLPTQPHLDLAIRVGSSRTDIVSRVLASAISGAHLDDETMTFRFRSLRVQTRPQVRAFADNQRCGRTPVTIAADAGAIRVIVP